MDKIVLNSSTILLEQAFMRAMI